MGVAVVGTECLQQRLQLRADQGKSLGNPSYQMHHLSQSPSGKILGNDVLFLLAERPLPHTDLQTHTLHLPPLTVKNSGHFLEQEPMKFQS